MVIITIGRTDMLYELKKLDKNILVQNVMAFHGGKAESTRLYWLKQDTDDLIAFLLETMAVANKQPIKRLDVVLEKVA